MIHSPLVRRMDVLRCPVTRESLTMLSATEVAATNQDFGTGLRLHRDGSTPRAPLANALGTRSRDYIYRIEDDIAWLLPNLALVRPGGVVSGLHTPEKEMVQSFYDDFGWVRGSRDVFNDTAEFTEPRPVAQDYLR
ncbi:MAG TPA: hypothetical protein VLW52_15050 [Opitutaceae bacterium]|nr:hypothetical protein [Opitutaceae bacterium]